MLWQDLVLTTGASILTAALIPTILDKKEKPALSTSVVSGSVLFGISVVYYTLSLWLSSVVVALHGILWFVLAVQRHLEVKDTRRRKKG